jgi:hypothetical protein
LVIFVVQIVDLVVTDEDLDAWVAGLEELFAQVAGRFSGSNRGVGPVPTCVACWPRWPVERLNAGRGRWRVDPRMQRLLNAAAWDVDGMRDDLRAYAVSHLGERDGVFLPLSPRRDTTAPSHAIAGDKTLAVRGRDPA